MTVTIVPFTIDSSCDCPVLLVGYEKEKHIKKNHAPITYWGIYLDVRRLFGSSDGGHHGTG